MSNFLDVASFLRRFPRTEIGHVPLASRCRFDGCIAFANWPHALAAGLLCEGLELAESPSASPDRHPVVFLFGDQVEGATYFGGLTFPIGIRYQEFALAVPFVRVAGSASLHTFVPRMVSNHHATTLAGNLHYGFGKQMGRMGWEGPVFLMTNEDGQLLFHAQVEAGGPWLSCAADTPPCLDTVRAAFALPIVGRRADGAFITCYFDWSFQQARVRPIDAALSIDTPFSPGLAAGWHYGDSTHSVEVRGMQWQLSWPRAYAVQGALPGRTGASTNAMTFPSRLTSPW